jgi:hypothetical protein
MVERLSPSLPVLRSRIGLEHGHDAGVTPGILDAPSV